MKIIYFIMIATLICFLSACKESLIVDKEDVTPPVITSFSPSSGPGGTEISISGDYLKKIDSIRIGGKITDIKYQINKNEIVALVNDNVVSGIIEVFTPYGKSESDGIFVVEYVIPVLEVYPLTAKPNSEITIEGKNMHAVIDIYFGDVKGIIISRSKESLTVQVPYFPELISDIFLAYNDNGETKMVGTSGKPFSLELVIPTVSSIPDKATIGYQIKIEGTNLDQIDRVTIGDKDAVIVGKTSNDLTIQLSTDYSATAELPVTLYYYGVETIIVSNAFEVIVPQIHFWDNIVLYGPNSENANFFNASTGQLYNPCQVADNANNIQLYIFGQADGLQFANTGTTNGFNRFKCDGKNITSVGTQMRFRKLMETNPADNKYIQMVKNRTLEKISVDILQADGIPVSGITRQVARHKLDTDPSNYNQTNAEGISIGGVNVFVYDVGGNPKIGFIELLEVQRASSSDQAGSLRFNCYYQKD